MPKEKTMASFVADGVRIPEAMAEGDLKKANYRSEPGRVIFLEPQRTVLDEILAELRAIRRAIENPKETALREIRETVTT